MSAPGTERAVADVIAWIAAKMMVIGASWLAFLIGRVIAGPLGV